MPTYDFECKGCGEVHTLQCKPSELAYRTPIVHIVGSETDAPKECGEYVRIYTPTAGIVNGASARNRYGLKNS